ncbi:MAG: response regulator, partial [Deltaproteobacteria bacterium]|nr:response regulator [Deltaproteobacteria bacterium]
VETFGYIPILYSDVSLSSKNKELVPIINVFKKALEAGIQLQLVELYNQGLDEYRHHKFFLKLTPEELNYIDTKTTSKDPIIYAAESDNYPLSFYNEVENEFQGISIDVLVAIAQITGLNFKRWNDKPVERDKLLEAVENGDSFMVTELIKVDDKKDRFIWSTVGYSSDKYALLSTTQTPDKEINEVLYSKVGIVEGTVWADVFFKWFRNHKNTIAYPSHQHAFKALTTNEIELFMGTRNLNLSMTNFMEQPGFKINIPFNYTIDSLYGFNKDEKLLCSVISKAINLVDAENITERWLQRTFDYRGKLARSRVPVLFAFSLMLILLLTLSFLLIKKSFGDKARLARIVNERTAELMVQKDEATKASRAKGDFLARMSHEIRTPMNAIIGMAELALREDLHEDTADMISNIQSAGASLLSIINDILDFSKIESGKMVLSNSDYQLSSLIQDVINVISPRFLAANLEFLIELDANLPATLFGDEVRLRQILLNLLSNGVKYTKEGSVTLRLEAELPADESRPSAGHSVGTTDLVSYINKGYSPLFREQMKAVKIGQTLNGTLPFTPNATSPVAPMGNEILLRISVIDTGIGIKPEDLGKLFGSFSQVDTEKNKGIEGTGLGLAISKNLAILMGGDITVVSEYKKGSVFTVTAKQTIPGAYLPLTSVKHPKKSRSIILDPDLTNKRFLSFALDSLGTDYLLINNQEELEGILSSSSSHSYDYLFAQAQSSDSVSALLKKLGSNIKPVFMLNFGEKAVGEKARGENTGGEKAKKRKDVQYIQKPVYSLTMANVFNDAEEIKTLRGRKERINLIAPDAAALVVDDILINLKVAKGLLSPFKLRVDTAESGQMALNLVKSNYYDIIFMDHMMPGMDGIETTERIRELPECKNIPIIALTANAISGVKEMFISHGMNDFISKPIEPGKLELMLSEWLPKEKLKTPLPKSVPAVVASPAAPGEPTAPSQPKPGF